MRRNRHRTPDNIRQNEQSPQLIVQKELHAGYYPA